MKKCHPWGPVAHSEPQPSVLQPELQVASEICAPPLSAGPNRELPRKDVKNLLQTLTRKQRRDVERGVMSMREISANML